MRHRPPLLAWMKWQAKTGSFQSTSRVQYGRRLQRYAQAGAIDAECTAEAAEVFRWLRHETLTAERIAVIGLRNDGAIYDEVLHRLEHELDVEALRAGIGELRVSSGNKRSQQTPSVVSQP